MLAQREAIRISTQLVYKLSLTSNHLKQFGGFFVGQLGKILKKLLFVFAVFAGVCTGVAHADNNCTGATYYDTDSDTCIACPAGYDYNTDAGKTDITECQIHCEAGTWGEYTQLEYIESTGTQWIDTGVKNSDVDEYYVKFKSRYAQYKFIFGNYIDEDTESTRLLFTDSNNKEMYSNVASIAKNPNSSGTTTDSWNEAWGRKSGSTTYFKMNTDDEVSRTVISGKANHTNIALFANMIGGSAQSSQIAAMQFKKDNALVRNFIPVRRNSDGVVGMYDMVSGQFFTNSGTGEFIAGPDVGGIGECTDVGAGYYAAASTVNFGSVGTRMACPTGLFTVGYGHGADDANDCARTLHIGDNVIYARRNKITTPSVNIQMTNGDMFYISLSSVNHNVSRLHLSYDGNQYTAYDDSLYYGERDFDTGEQIGQ